MTPLPVCPCDNRRTSRHVQGRSEYAPAVHVVLVQPEIAGNTGAIIRLCANTGCDLHLVEPLGFELDDSRMKRGGLDYHEFANLTVYPDLAAVQATLTGRWFGFTSRAERIYTDVQYQESDVFVFGAERAGLSDDDMALIPANQLLSIPMQAGNRSMNLANAASVVVYEAWRQQGFAGAGGGEGSLGLTSETTAAPPFDS
jgi:tRNA (cytidine/uridine-2'-O-)-methyltransferase